MTVVINGTTGIDTGTGSLIAADATTPTYLDLFEDTDNGSNYVRLIAPTSIAANRTLTLPDGTGTFVVNGVNGSLVSDTAKASTSGTSIDFTGIPSWVKRITVMFSGVSTNGSSNILVQIGSGSFTTSGYSGSVMAGTVFTANSAGFNVMNNMSAANLNSGNVVITAISSLIYSSSGNVFGSANIGSASGGAVTLGGTLDRVRITTVNGTDTFDAGTINILYE